MKNEKYRTPLIEEFIEGFQYEECNNGIWCSRICFKIKGLNPCDINSFKIFYEQVKNNFRVKIMKNQESFQHYYVFVFNLTSVFF